MVVRLAGIEPTTRAKCTRLRIVLTLGLHALAAPEGWRHPLFQGALSRDSLVEPVRKVLKPCVLVALLNFGFSEISSLRPAFSL